jgi:hypothetical protein
MSRERPTIKTVHIQGMFTCAQPTCLLYVLAVCLPGRASPRTLRGTRNVTMAHTNAKMLWTIVGADPALAHGSL